jgi:hypothetical protein
MHAESLLHIPLVRQLLGDRRVILSPRQVDQHWFYERFIPISVSGFNHFLGRVFYPSRSMMSRWLLTPECSARDLNDGDILVKEVLIAVHDYLHVWALQFINGRRPELGLGVAPLTAANAEDMAFCHLVTEAAAVVGLDYWYLSTMDLNRVVPIGSTLEGLTVAYHEQYADEYRRFNPSFRVQEQGFFPRICQFYCDGVFRGFGLSALKRSPRVLKWLKHELSYGMRQRQYIRLWLRHLSGGQLDYQRADLQAPIDSGASWKQQLMGEVAEALWDKVKNDRMNDDGAPIDPTAVWKAPAEMRPDFRFVNANMVDPGRLRGMDAWEDGAENLRYYLCQFVSGFDCGGVDPELKTALVSLTEHRDVRLVQRLFRGQPEIPAVSEWPDLLILN